MSNLELVDLLGVYPLAEEHSDIQRILTSKKEFQELAGSAYEPPPKRGEKFKSQELVVRLMQSLDRLLIMWGTGTGKTCAMIAPAEHYKNIVDATFRVQEETPIKRVIVLVRGDSLKAEFRNQLVCKCNPYEVYERKIKGSENVEASVTSVIFPQQGFGYEIFTYGAFAKEINKLNRGDEEAFREEIAMRYSGTLFLIDEAHNLRVDPDAETSETYSAIHTTLHSVKRSKVIVATATPMINAASEIASLMNLILPLDNQMPTGREDEFYANFSDEDARRYFTGKISYVRALETGAVPHMVGERIPGRAEDGSPYYTIVDPSKMSDFQARVYTRVNQEFGSSNFYSLSRQAANFVFPDESVGGRLERKPGEPLTGLGKYVRRKQGTVEDYEFYGAPGEALRQDMSTLEGLRKYSCKFADIVKTVRDEPGSAFCYTEYVVGGGAILLSLAFEALGFKRFRSSTSVIGGATGQKLSFCESDAPSEGRQVLLTKEPRYALLTSSTPTSVFKVIRDTFNSPENAHGELIKVIIGSPETRDGINLANVQQVHLLGPAWTQAGMYQSISRAIRATSHVVLLRELREKVLREGGDPSLVTVPVNIYKHVAQPPPGVFSVDLHIYESAENKDRVIKKVERLMKRSAVDCQINRPRNQARPSDLDGSPECDYQSCSYTCLDPEPDSTDLSTYDLLYSAQEFSKIQERLEQEFQKRERMTFEQVYTTLADVPRKYLDLLLGRAVSERTIFHDRFGFPVYLVTDGDILFLESEYPLSTSRSVADLFYTASPTVVEDRKLQTLAKVSTQASDDEYLRIVRTGDPDSSRFQEALQKLSLANKIAVLEEALLQILQGNDDERWSKIREEFRNQIFSFHEPLDSIQEARDKLREPKKGRQPKEGTLRKLKDFQPREDPAYPLVFLHTLRTMAPTRTSYSVSSSIGKVVGEDLRILRPGSTAWNDVQDPGEIVTYTTLISQKVEAEKARLRETSRVYGTVSKADGKFRIVDTTREDTTLAQRDKRLKSTGKTCQTWLVPDLLELISRLDIDPPQMPDFARDESLDVVANNKIAEPLLTRKDKRPALAELPDGQIRRIAQWVYSGVLEKDSLCSQIEQFLRDQDLILDA